MVFCDSEELKWMPFVKTWITDVCGNVLREETQEYLLNLFAKTVENGLRFVSKKCVQAIAQVSTIYYSVAQFYDVVTCSLLLLQFDM